jgi:hypothetical protein
LSRLDPLLVTLSSAPDAQIQGIITTRIKRLIGCTNEIVTTELLEIRDECIAKALASSFAIEVINQAIEVAQVKD